MNIFRSSILRENVVIHENCTVGEGTEVSNSVVGKQCSIGRNCVLENAFVFDNVTIGDKCILKNCVISENTTIQAASAIHHGTVIGPGCVIPEKSSIDKQFVVASENGNSFFFLFY